jgi:hypothetical protein
MANLGLMDIRYPTDYQLSDINLISPMQGGKIPLMGLLVELNLFEDIYSSSITGQIVLSDALGIVSNFLMNGSEFVELTLRKFNDDELPIKRNFRVYKIADRVMGDSTNYEIYTLNICSEEFLISEQYRISKSFKGQKISDIVTSIMVDYLKVGLKNTKQIYIEPTTGLYDFILPNKKIFETVNWLATYAQPDSKNPGADFVFYENSLGYFFNSLQTLYKQDPWQTFKYDPKNISTKGISNDLQEQITNVMSFEVLNFFDVLGGITDGTFNNRVISIDPVTRKKTVTDFNYNDFFARSESLNKAALINNYKDRVGKKMYEAPPKDLQAGTLRLVTSNSQQKKNAWVSQKPDAVANDIFIEKYMPNRVSQLGQINYTRLKITVPGSPQLMVGKTINFMTFGISPDSFSRPDESTERKPDPLYSGKYLITAVRHVVKKDNTYITVMEICSDSGSVAYPTFDGSNAELQNYVKGVQ